MTSTVPAPKRITGMASVLYDLRMICWLFCLAEVRSGVGVVKNPEPGVILAERKSCLFSPDRDLSFHQIVFEYSVSVSIQITPDWLFISSASFDTTPLPAAILPSVDFYLLVLPSEYLPLLDSCLTPYA